MPIPRKALGRLQVGSFLPQRPPFSQRLWAPPNHSTAIQKASQEPALSQRTISTWSKPSRATGSFLPTAALLSLSLSLGLYLHKRHLHADSSSEHLSRTSDAPIFRPIGGLLLWGDNEHHVVQAASDDKKKIIKTPSERPEFAGRVFRDIALAKDCGVAVDEKGHVIQWGAGYGSESPEVTLKGKNICSVALSAEKVYALGRDGTVYVLPQHKGEDGKVIGVSNDRSSSGWTFWRTTTQADAPSEKTPYVTLRPNVALGWGERVASISAGEAHVLLLTNKGRVFATPSSSRGNEYGQLGVREVETNEGPVTLAPRIELNERSSRAFQLPKKLDPLLLPPSESHIMPASPEKVLGPDGQLVSYAELEAQLAAEEARNKAFQEQEGSSAKDITFCTTFYEVKALQNIAVDEIATGQRHSLVRTAGGAHVLAWGSNQYGQLGLGASFFYPVIPMPTELPFVKAYPRREMTSSVTGVTCEKIAAGGNVSYFVLKRTGSDSLDVMACGNGQFGGIGNALWAHTHTPARIKTLSDLNEWDEKNNTLAPVGIRSISTGKKHVVVTMNSGDVFIWGHNEFYQLGTGKRSNLSVPTLLPFTVPVVDVEGKNNVPVFTKERFQTFPLAKYKGYTVQEAVVAGDGMSGIYWRVV